MEISTSVTNGMLSQNYASIENVNKLVKSKTSSEIENTSNNTLQEISEESAANMKNYGKYEPKTIEVTENEFISNFYSQTEDNITFSINGVTYSNQEMKACKEIMKQAISALPEKGSDLDYKDYASMGLAINLVNSYTSSNLTEQQAEAVNQCITDYMTQLINAEDEQQNKNYDTDNTTSDLNTYYNKRYTVNLNEENAAEFINLINSNADLPESTKETLLDNFSNGTSVVQSASNKELAQNIMDTFSNININDSKSISEAYQIYKNQITPAYQSYGLSITSENNSLANVINQDINTFAKTISNFRAVLCTINTQPFDSSI